jgi:stearoyl-CoA desaturase (delta-9 desaturase)
MSGEGSAITWTAIHRGYHHRHSDTDRDIHSPTRGFYHAFFGWATKITEASNIINLKYAANLLRKPNVIWFHENQMRILWLTPIVTAMVFGWQVALALFVLPTGITLLQDNLVNVFGHTKAGIGYRHYDTDDRSQNNVILGYLGWGQGWHNNHHHAPAEFDFGSGVSGRWWEWDPCNIFKPFLK